MNLLPIICTVCEARAATFFERVCNSCMVEIVAVADGKYPAHDASRRIERVTDAIAMSQPGNELCHCARHLSSVASEGDC
jgi:hypothetical protein